MSVDEQKTMNKAENHARSAIVSSGMSVQTGRKDTDQANTANTSTPFFYDDVGVA